MSDRKLRWSTAASASKVFLLSGLCHEERKDLMRKITSLGGLCFDFQDFKAHCTHVVCGRLSRSEKFLGACATGKWVLHPQYVHQSAQYKSWLDEEQFEWCDERFTQETEAIPHSLVVAPRRWRFLLGSERGAFTGWNVAVITGGGRSKVIQRLLISGGAKVYNLKLPVKDPEKVANTIGYIFVSSNNVQAVSHMFEYGVLCVKPEFIGEYLIKDPPADPMDFLANVQESEIQPELNPPDNFLNVSYASSKTPSLSLSPRSSQNSLPGTPTMKGNKINHTSTPKLPTPGPSHTPPAASLSPLGVLCQDVFSPLQSTSSENSKLQTCTAPALDNFELPKTRSRTRQSIVNVTKGKCSGKHSSKSQTSESSHSGSVRGIDEIQVKTGKKIRSRESKDKHTTVRETESGVVKQGPSDNEERIETLSQEQSGKVLSAHKKRKDDFDPGAAALQERAAYDLYVKTLGNLPQPRTSKRLQQTQNVLSTLNRQRMKSGAGCSQPMETEENTERNPAGSCFEDMTEVPVKTTPPVSSSKKRKARVDTELQETLKYLKRHKISHNEWRPSVLCVSVELLENEKSSDSSYPLLDTSTNLIHSLMEEGLAMAALKEISRQVTCKRYPPPRTISVIIKNILLKSRSDLEADLCYKVLIKILKLHPPSSPTLQEVYTKAIQEVGRCVDGEVTSGIEWSLLKTCLRCAMNGHTCCEIECAVECRMVDNHKLLLQFLVALIEQNFRHCLESCRLAASQNLECRPKNSILLRVLWSPDFHVVLNNKCRELLNLFAECLQWIDIKQTSTSTETKMEILQLILSLISMATEYCRLVESRSVEGSIQSLQHEKTSAFVYEISRRITDGNVQDVSVIQCIMKCLRYHWLCAGVCKNLLSTMDDYLLAENQLRDVEGLSLSVIVGCYFFLLPRFQKIKNDQETPESPVKQQRASKKTGQSNRCLFEGKPDGILSDKKISKKNSKGETLLHIACIKNDVPKLKQLLNTPGSIRLRNIRWHNGGVTRLVGIDVNVVDNAGWTPLHEACNHGHMECVQELLKFVPAKTVDQFFNKDRAHCRKVDLLAKTADGITPLHDAVICNQLEVCKMLLQHGGSKLLMAVTELNFTPLQLATSEDMISLLSSFLPSPVRRVDMEDSISSSQESLEELRTDLPSDHLYDKVLQTGTGQVCADKNSLLKYIRTVTTLVKSYLKLNQLKLIQDHLRNPAEGTVRVVKQYSSPLAHPLFPDKTQSNSCESDRNENCVGLCKNSCAERNNNLVNKYSCASSDAVTPSDGDHLSCSGQCQTDEDTEIKETSCRLIRKDLRVFRNMSSHLLLFKLHLYKLSQKEHHAVIDTELEELFTLIG